MDKNKINPKGERKNADNLPALDSIPVDTSGGRVHVKWDSQTSLTPLGQLAFFIEFLKTGGIILSLQNRVGLHFRSSVFVNDSRII